MSDTNIVNPNINSILITGLCSAIGRMEPEIVARQMACAYKRVFHDSYKFSCLIEEKLFELYSSNIKINSPSLSNLIKTP